jgi:hypothetical protein
VVHVAAGVPTNEAPNRCQTLNEFVDRDPHSATPTNPLHSRMGRQTSYIHKLERWTNEAGLTVDGLNARVARLEAAETRRNGTA